MALPSSGPISMSMVRTETSQSLVNNYELKGSLLALNNWALSATNIYAPINVGGISLPEGKFNFPNSLNYSMSYWYDYNHSAYTLSQNTASLYHISDYCYSKTMVIIDLGTENGLIDINISGSVTTAGDLEVYYGKPWKNDGSQYTSSISTLVTSSIGITSLNATYQYDYTYDSNVGQYLYVVYVTGCL
jgi:hypothetical protein